MEQELNNEFKHVFEALKKEDIDLFRENFLEMHPYDQTRLFSELEEEERMRLYSYLSPGEMADIFEKIEIEDTKGYLFEMEPFYAAKMLGDMYADDAVDVLNDLEAEQLASYLTIMDDEAAQEIKELLHYEEKTAGSIMTTEFVAIRANQTVTQAMQILRKEAPDAETIYYVFVVDENKKLVGVISLRDLIIAEEDTLVTDVMNERVVAISVGEDQEEAARMMKDYDFLALPVVDFQNHLLGIITVDDIVDVIDEEASEDYSKLAAVSDMDSADRSPIQAAKRRLPWLIILLFLGMITASLIGQFEQTLNQVAILAVFIPLIAGMAGNTGTQALAVAVRGIATGDTDKQDVRSLVLREAGTGVITGTSCGLIIMIIVYLWKDSIYLGLLVGASILMTLIVATLAGALIPLLMHKMKIDPAVASGPFITTINDIISVLIYFGLATAFINYFT
ncbi:magnesium transporter [Pseudalkalibacillus salsuginis]|uniref:magnesium transporter n=1 Tax=Pseudalkalibacillus salsuginis TaxID=2910972 RepID=UPI001F3CC946|nr:magnesium transporter [Pseudalkalibacillus salsuginis]MCF6409177.1 magnesium transporter [Pseudalkalibacillus salsuginis]